MMHWIFRRSLLAAALTAVLAGTSIAGEAGKWYAEGEVLYLHRDGEDALVANRCAGAGELGSDCGSPPGIRVPALDTGDATPGFAPGGRVSLGYWWREDLLVEISAMGVVNGGGARIEDLAQNIYPTFDDSSIAGTSPIAAANSDFQDAFAYDLDYDTYLAGIEFNQRRQVSDRVSLLAGLRFAALGDDLTLTSFDDDPSVSPPTPPGQGNVGEYRLKTHNYMTGFQVGGDVNLPLASGLTFDFLGKAGIYLNRQTYDMSYIENSIPAGTGNEQFNWRAAGLFDTGVRLSWQFMPNALLSVGYNAIYLVGVAVAPNQFAQSASSAEFSNFDTGGSALYHGPTARVVLRLN